MSAVIVTATAPGSRVPEVPAQRADLPAAPPPIPVALHRSLPGYTEYTRKVRWRLIPGIF